MKIVDWMARTKSQTQYVASMATMIFAATAAASDLRPEIYGKWGLALPTSLIVLVLVAGVFVMGKLCFRLQVREMRWNIEVNPAYKEGLRAMLREEGLIPPPPNSGRDPGR